MWIGDGLHRNGDDVDEILKLTGLDGFLDGSLDGIFIAGIGMHNIPFCCFRHAAT